jgi:hypothetical protein
MVYAPDALVFVEPAVPFTVYETVTPESGAPLEVTVPDTVNVVPGVVVVSVKFIVSF